ncbi:MAG TPA: GNAT family N-acetyltransferase [Solirubrobacterales bacterium]
MPDHSADHRLHVNLVDSSRQLFELDPDAAVVTGEDRLFGAGSHSHPVISNAAFRRDDSLGAGELVARAQDFFGDRGREFSVWVRAGVAADQDLSDAVAAAGFQLVYEMPEMSLAAPVEELPLPSGADLRQLSVPRQAEDYWKVAAASYASIGFPAEIFSGYSDHAGLLAENVAAFIAYLNGEPVSVAMTLVSHGVAGIYWVGSLEPARGRGLGRAVTAAAMNAGFELGAEIASLQASPMGKPIYEAMGYETVHAYQLFMSPSA